MIVSVTTLGSADGDAASAALGVVSYLEGHRAQRPGRSPGQMPDLARGEGPNAGVVAYYADSVEGPGTWVGRGTATVRPSGEVSAEALHRVLLGQDPFTGAQLVGARGSAARAEQLGRVAAAVASHGPDDELLTLSQAASLLHVSSRHLRRVVSDTQRVEAHRAREEAAGSELTPLVSTRLHATRAGANGHWRVTRAEVRRFAAARRAPAAVVGYDLTFSVPKSVSILWAGADAGRRAQIVQAVNCAVGAGMVYLEDNASSVQGDHGRTIRAGGLVAASYLHATSRALDPQLHCHVVVANMAEGPDGAVRALDGRRLYAHAKTAGYLAAAELRSQMSRRLGVEWHPAERGLADVAGVPRAAIEAMSQRSGDLQRVLDDLTRHLSPQARERWLSSAAARQMAAYASRGAKDHGVDPAALRPYWLTRLAAAGLDPAGAEACYHRQPATRLVSVEEREALFAELASARGVTEMAATFDRRDVIQYVAEWAGDRLSASEICDLADGWLASEVVVSVEAPSRDGRRGDVIRLSTNRTVSAVRGEALYTTPGMLDVEQRLLSAYQRGRQASAGVVAPELVDAALAARPRLGEDQAAMVRSVTGSGQRIQCVLGPAGSGKTTALEAAVRAWEQAGFEPVGAAVQGTAAELLGNRTGIPSTTVASLLVRLDTAADSPIGPATVILVDEASTLANRDLAALAAHVERAGATLRLVGDPAQHGAVAAGGGWRHLVEAHAEDTPVLTELRRQAAPEMEDMRAVLPLLREGDVAAATERLRSGQRVIEADSPDELLDALVADWYVDRTRRRHDPCLEPSAMVAEHHVERHELNARARALLREGGELTGPVLSAGGVDFQAGDEVIAVAQARDLRPAGGGRSSFVRNGLRGRVSEVRPADADRGEGAALVVDFERRGPVVVPEDHLTRAVRPGVTGVLAHSYAVTSHQAQGDTYEAARHLGTDRSTLAGVYVGLSRGRSDARLYVLRSTGLMPPPDNHPGMPVLGEERSAFEELIHSLQSQRSERLASDVDANAGAVARLRAAQSPADLWARAQDEEDDLARRALGDELARVVTRARLHPDPALVARLGARPEPGPARAAWDRAVGDVSAYRALWPSAPTPGGAAATWALGVAPEHAGALAHYEAARASLHQAEVAVAAARPTADLVAERRELQASVVLAPSPAQRDTAAGLTVLAARHLGDADAHVERARRHMSELEAAPRRRRNAQGLELARRSLASATHDVATRSQELARAEARSAALDQDLAAHAPVQERLAVVEGALHSQVERAVSAPAAYVRRVLGPEPTDSAALSGWRAAARVIETYRHEKLGLGPEAASVSEEGLEQALGPRPRDRIAAQGWDAAHLSVSADVGHDVDLEAPSPEPPVLEL